MRLGFIGTGEMGSALILALAQHEVVAANRSKERLASLPVTALPTNTAVVERADIIFLAVKPQDLTSVLEEIKDVIEGKIIISVAAAYSLDRMAAVLGERKLVRIMPNIPCAINEMAAGYAIRNLDEQDIAQVHLLFSELGKAYRIEESQMDAQGAISGCGPAFVAELLTYFIDAGVAQGLSKELATALALQTMKGTVAFLEHEGIGPDELVRMVCSPNGVTEAGMETMRASGVREGIRATINCAIERTREMQERLDG